MAQKNFKKLKHPAGPGRPKGLKDSNPRPRQGGIIPEFALDEIDKLMLKIEATTPNLSHLQMGREVNLNYRIISFRRRRAIYVTALTEMSRDAIDLIQANQKLAAREIASLIRSADQNVKLSAIKLLLQPLLDSTVNVNVNATVGSQKTVEQMSDEELISFVAMGLEALQRPDASRPKKMQP